MNAIILKKNEDQRIRKGHPWVFDNEIEEVRGGPAPGEFLDIFSFSGDLLGQGYFNPVSKIRVRVFSRGYRFTNGIDPSSDFRILSEKRIQKALSKRERLVPQQEAYRVVFSDGDYLPGLIVDRYKNLLMVQFLTKGMFQRRTIIIGLLDQILNPDYIYIKQDARINRQEGIESDSMFVKGGDIFQSPFLFSENGITYELDPIMQKTGFYLDQAVNRAAVASLCSGRSVLDCFCFTGGFSLSAAKGGATQVVGMDSSVSAISMAERNAVRNHFPMVQFNRKNVFEEIRRMKRYGSQFDVVILDPPAFAKHSKDLPTARKGYRDINRLGLLLIKPGGVLVSCSCSHSLDQRTFNNILHEAARDAHRQFDHIEWSGASPDHPVLTEVPETAYLRCAIARIT